MLIVTVFNKTNHIITNGCRSIFIVFIVYYLNINNFFFYLQLKLRFKLVFIRT